MFTLANGITLLRLILAPFVFWLLLQPENLGYALVVLTVAGLTDVLDGWAARSRNEVSEWGKVLDPLADKALMIGIMFALVISWHLPAWLVWIYFGKELLQVLAGAVLLRKQRSVIASNQWGKASTFCFFLGFGLFLIPQIRFAGMFVIGIAVALSIYAFFSYYQIYRKQSG